MSVLQVVLRALPVALPGKCVDQLKITVPHPVHPPGVALLGMHVKSNRIIQYLSVRMGKCGKRGKLKIETDVAFAVLLVAGDKECQVNRDDAADDYGYPL